MANTKSARKRVRTTERNRTRNRVARSAVRTSIKTFRSALESNDPKAPALLKEIHALLDHHSARGLLHSGTASRYKSRLTLALAKTTARG